MDEIVATFFAAWNEADPERRRELLQRCLASDAELVDPSGHWRGLDGLVERIDRYQAAAPGTRVVPTSGIDAHHHVVRYGWAVVDGEGRSVIDGIDVAQRLSDGRLWRILMFHGSLPAAD